MVFQSFPVFQVVDRLRSLVLSNSSSSPAISKLVCLVLNHLLAQHGEHLPTLASSAGKVCRISVLPVSLMLVLRQDGYFEAVEDRSDVLTQVDTDISMRWVDLVGMVRSPKTAARKASIRGDMDFAQILSSVFSNLSWDAEHDLARVVGDVQAVWIVQGLSSFGTSVQEVFERFKANLRDFVVYEQFLAPTVTEFDAFRHDLAVLRDDMARLEKRMARLEVK